MVMIWNPHSTFMLADVCSESCRTAHGRSGAQNATHWRNPCQLIAPHVNNRPGGVCLSGEEGAKAADEEILVAGKNAADQEAAMPQEEAAPVARAS